MKRQTNSYMWISTSHPQLQQLPQTFPELVKKYPGDKMVVQLIPMSLKHVDIMVVLFYYDVVVSVR